MKTAIYQPSPTQFRYLTDKVVTWGDSSVEYVQIDQDSFVHLNGVRKRLVSFVDFLDFAAGTYIDSSNLTILNTELSYFAGKGIRIMCPTIWYYGNGSSYEAAYDAVLQVYYNNKIFVVPHWTARVTANFDNLTTTNFSLGTETVTQGFTKWLTHMLSATNTVAIIIESELDLPPGGDSYTLANMEAYIAQLYNIARSMTNMPIINKLTTAVDGFAPGARTVLTKYSTLPCFDVYNSTSAGFTLDLNTMQKWRQAWSSVPQLWIGETNYASAGYDYTQFTKSMMDALFASCSVIFIAGALAHQSPTQAFIKDDGTPQPNCDTLLGAGTPGTNVTTWQAAI